MNSDYAAPAIRETAASPLTTIDPLEYDHPDDVSDISGLTGAFPDGRQVENKISLAQINETESPAPTVVTEESYRSGRAPSAPGEGASVGARSLGSRSGGVLKSVKSSQSGMSRSRKVVGFDQVEVRYYERIVTDNPAVQSGPAIGIGWRYRRGGRVDIDYWEQGKGVPRTSSEMVLPRHVRERMLTENGVSKKDMADMVRVTLRVKNQRKQTVNNLSVAGMEEAVEKATRRMSRLLSFGRSRDIIKK